jgi:putative acetyltransferase
MTLQLRHETPDDIAAIEAVTTAAFADAPHTSHTEQFIVRALRAAKN